MAMNWRCGAFLPSLGARAYVNGLAREDGSTCPPLLVRYQSCVYRASLPPLSRTHASTVDVPRHPRVHRAASCKKIRIPIPGHETHSDISRTDKNSQSNRRSARVFPGLPPKPFPKERHPLHRGPPSSWERRQCPARPFSSKLRWSLPPPFGLQPQTRAEKMTSKRSSICVG